MNGDKETSDLLDRRRAVDALVAKDVDLAVLALVLDADALAERIGRPARVQRLRYKPGTAVHAAVTIEGEPGWHLLVDYGRGGMAKAGKDTRAARARGRQITAQGERWVLVPARADRRLPHARLSTMDAGAIDLAYNPRRRLVVAGPTGERPRWVTKVHSRGSTPVRGELVAELRAAGVPTPEAQPTRHRQVTTTRWQEGHPARPAHDGRAVAEALATLAEVRPATSAPRWDATRLLDRVDRALVRLSLLRPHRATEVGALRSAFWHRRHQLDRLAPALVHGDLSPDQVLVEDERAWLLDLDTCGMGPEGWDRATWCAAQVASGIDAPVALPGPMPDPVLSAAAFALRGPEPFSRQRHDWPGRTDRMLHRAAAALGLDAGAGTAEAGSWPGPGHDR